MALVPNQPTLILFLPGGGGTTTPTSFHDTVFKHVFHWVRDLSNSYPILFGFLKKKKKEKRKKNDHTSSPGGR